MRLNSLCASSNTDMALMWKAGAVSGGGNIYLGRSPACPPSISAVNCSAEAIRSPKSDSPNFMLKSENFLVNKSPKDVNTTFLSQLLNKMVFIEGYAPI